MLAAGIMSCWPGWIGFSRLGQFVLTGEPVAVMGNGSRICPHLWQPGVRLRSAVLYVEFRKDGTPVDPSPWWATTKAKRFADDAQDVLWFSSVRPPERH